jgi:hypothetical protein
MFRLDILNKYWHTRKELRELIDSSHRLRTKDHLDIERELHPVISGNQKYAAIFIFYTFDTLIVTLISISMILIQNDVGLRILMYVLP